jgi:hypothetical protein
MFRPLLGLLGGPEPDRAPNGGKGVWGEAVDDTDEES